MKKDVVKLEQLIPIYDIQDSKPICNFGHIAFPVDGTFYIKMKHPVLKNKIVYIPGTFYFILTNIVNEINHLVTRGELIDEMLKSKVNDFILILKRIDSDNNINHEYSVIVKNTMLYIL